MITNGLFTSNKKDWTTPRRLFDELNDEFHFTLDACASEENHLCDKYYTKENSCLNKEWINETVFINPPYGREIFYFVRKCWLEALCNDIKIVALLPARTDTKWFHTYIYKFRRARIKFIEGRLKFGNSKNSAPFPSMIVYFNC